MDILHVEFRWVLVQNHSPYSQRVTQFVFMAYMEHLETNQYVLTWVAFQGTVMKENCMSGGNFHDGLSLPSKEICSKEPLVSYPQPETILLCYGMLLNCCFRNRLFLSFENVATSRKMVERWAAERGSLKFGVQTMEYSSVEQRNPGTQEGSEVRIGAHEQRE